MALMRQVASTQIADAQQRLADDVELLTPAQHTRLAGGNVLRSLLGLGGFFALLFVVPLVGFVLTVFVARAVLGLGETAAIACGGLMLVPSVFVGFLAGKRLERAIAASLQARTQRALASLQLEALSVSSSSSVAVPVSSSASSSSSSSSLSPSRR